MALLAAPPPPAADPDKVFAAVLRKWLAGKPRYYSPLQAAARAWLARKG